MKWAQQSTGLNWYDIEYSQSIFYDNCNHKITLAMTSLNPAEEVNPYVQFGYGA